MQVVVGRGGRRRAKARRQKAVARAGKELIRRQKRCKLAVNVTETHRKRSRQRGTEVQGRHRQRCEVFRCEVRVSREGNEDDCVPRTTARKEAIKAFRAKAQRAMQADGNLAGIVFCFFFCFWGSDFLDFYDFFRFCGFPSRQGDSARRTGACRCWQCRLNGGLVRRLRSQWPAQDGGSMRGSIEVLVWCSAWDVVGVLPRILW